MFSDFKINNENRIENYIQRLISLLTGKHVIFSFFHRNKAKVFKEFDEEFEVLNKYAISTINNHKFLETDKFKILKELKG